MNRRTLANQINELASYDISLTPHFSPVITDSGESKPFKRLPALACADARLKPGANGK
jgi:hypothetical protein